MNEETREPFSRRYGYSTSDREITVREDALQEFRAAPLHIARKIGLRPSILRTTICEVLHKFPNGSNWSASPIWEEIQDLIQECEWFRVYDVTEAIYNDLLEQEHDQASNFEVLINAYLREAGIGWHLIDGVVQTRGSEAFESVVRDAATTLDGATFPTASSEIHEALRDLSRRPEPDLTGAIQHAMAALECVAREACGDSKLTLRDIMRRYPQMLPQPLDNVVSKAWGYASEMGRHIQEGRPPIGKK
jgi:AbiJ N-terminal domain 4